MISVFSRNGIVPPTPTPTATPYNGPLFDFDASLSSYFTPNATTNTVITTWNDSTINNFTTSSVVYNAPKWISGYQNGLGVLDFNYASTGNLFTSTTSQLNSLSGFTVFFVGELNTSYTTQNILDLVQNTSGPSNTFRLSGGMSGVSLYVGSPQSVWTVPQYVPDNSAHVFSVAFNKNGSTNSDRIKFFVDGVEQVINFNGQTVTSGDLNSAINAFAIGYSTPFKGKAFELVFYNRHLDLSEQTTNVNNLMTKWGIVPPPTPTSSPTPTPTITPTQTITPTITPTFTPTPTVELIPFYQHTTNWSSVSNGQFSITTGGGSYPGTGLWSSILGFRFNRNSVLGPNNEGKYVILPSNAGFTDNDTTMSSLGVGSTITLEGLPYDALDPQNTSVLDAQNSSITIQLTSAPYYNPNAGDPLYVTGFTIVASTGTGWTQNGAYRVTFNVSVPTPTPTVTATPTLTITPTSTITPTPTSTTELIQFYEFTGGANTTNLGEMTVEGPAGNYPTSVDWGTIVRWKFNKNSVLGPGPEGVYGRIPYNAGVVDNTTAFQNFGIGSTITLEGIPYNPSNPEGFTAVGKSVTIQLTSQGTYDSGSSTLTITGFTITSSTGTGFTQGEEYQVTINPQQLAPASTAAPTATQSPTPTPTETPVPTATENPTPTPNPTATPTPTASPTPSSTPTMSLFSVVTSVQFTDTRNYNVNGFGFADLTSNPTVVEDIMCDAATNNRIVTYGANLLYSSLIVGGTVTETNGFPSNGIKVSLSTPTTVSSSYDELIGYGNSYKIITISNGTITSIVDFTNCTERVISYLIMSTDDGNGNFQNNLSYAVSAYNCITGGTCSEVGVATGVWLNQFPTVTGDTMYSSSFPVNQEVYAYSPLSGGTLSPTGYYVINKNSTYQLVNTSNGVVTEVIDPSTFPTPTPNPTGTETPTPTITPNPTATPNPTTTPNPTPTIAPPTGTPAPTSTPAPTQTESAPILQFDMILATGYTSTDVGDGYLYNAMGGNVNRPFYNWNQYNGFEFYMGQYDAYGNQISGSTYNTSLTGLTVTITVVNSPSNYFIGILSEVDIKNLYMGDDVLLPFVWWKITNNFTPSYGSMTEGDLIRIKLTS